MNRLMEMADRDRRDLQARNGPLTPSQAAIAASRKEGLDKIRAILAEPRDPKRLQRGLAEARRAMEEALRGRE
jgi:hypothetical protein